MQSLPARSADGAPDPAALAAALRALQAGGLVILPTDTVYGLAADSAAVEAVARLFTAKARPREKAIPLLAADAAQAGTVADLRAAAIQALTARWWPGPLTVVARAMTPLVEGVGSAGTVGVRVPDDAVVRLLARQLGRPLAVTSANRSGAAANAGFAAAVRDLRRHVAVALDGGPCPGGVASTVVDATGPDLVILRQGAITLD